MDAPEDLLVRMPNVNAILRVDGMKLSLLSNRLLQPDPYRPHSLEALYPSHLERVTADGDYWKWLEVFNPPNLQTRSHRFSLGVRSFSPRSTFLRCVYRLNLGMV